MLQRYDCIVTKVNKSKGSFQARVLGLDETITCSLSDVDPEEVHMVKKGVKFVWFIGRYQRILISFSPRLFQQNPLYQ
jgi:hypothetical protein